MSDSISAVASNVISSVQDFDEIMAFRFLVSIGAETNEYGTIGFEKVDGLGGEIEVIERRTGSEPDRHRKLPGLQKVNAITLSKGVTQNNSLWEWFDAMRKATLANTANVLGLRKTIKIDERNNGMIVKSWILDNCWISSYKPGTWDAKSSDVLIEEAVIQVEDFNLLSVFSVLASAVGG